MPIIYASSRLKYLDLARIWKIKFNENSKIPAFCNYFPELNHNELVGFENNGYPVSIATSIIILRDDLDLPRIKERIELTAEILKPTGVQAQFVDIKGEDILYKIFDNILLSDWTSYYLALEYKIDPTPVKLNDEFKKLLK
ncbi:MAG: hypothetical protein HYT20_01715 [Candidatus Nealsonbacteria bacterium]|nr:hypothetical protein [Candidatus Nealsonbacteria bacterium]